MYFTTNPFGQPAMVDGGACRFGTDSQSLPSSATVSQGQLVPQVAPQLIVQQLVKPGKPILSTLDRTLGYLPAGRCCLSADREFIGGRGLGICLSTRWILSFACVLITLLNGPPDAPYPWSRAPAAKPEAITRVSQQVQLYEGSKAVSVHLHLICHRAANGCF